MLKILYWILLGTILYVYAGYPLLLLLIRTLRGKKDIKKADYYPYVSLIMAVYNEEAVITKRIENILELTYPKDKLEVLIVSDASSDKTESIVKEFEGQGITLLRQENRQGKTVALNKAVNNAKGEILVFTDADVFFQKDNIEKLVANFNDPEVGCVAGKKIPIKNAKSYTASEGLYWKYEFGIKKMESDLGNLVSGTCGLNLALRKILYKPMEAMAEDLLLPFFCISKGYRTVFEPEAVCFELLLPSAKEEFNRKIRVVSGGIDALSVGKDFIRSFSFFNLFQLWSHKILRWYVSFGLLALLVLNFFIKGQVYSVLLWLQIAFYLMAIVGALMEGIA